jgi:hypothetical protein
MRSQNSKFKSQKLDAINIWYYGSLVSDFCGAATERLRELHSAKLLK